MIRRPARQWRRQCRFPATAATGTLISVLLAVLLLLGPSCGPAYRKIDFKEVEWEDIHISETPDQEEHPGASAVYLLDEGEFSARNNFILSRHVIIKILDEAGLSYANVEIPFHSESEVHKIRGRTVRKDGSVVMLKPEDVHEKSIYPDYVLYADSKAKVFALPGAEVGSVIEYSYSVVYKGPFPSAWDFQREEPVLLSRFTLDVPEFARYDYLLSQRKGIEVAKSVSHPVGRVRAVFTLKDAPPITPEPLMPAPSEVTTRVYFSLTALSTFGLTVPIEGDSWEILGQSYYQATEDKVKASKAISKKLEEITRDCAGELDKIARVYDFVQSQIRYVAIEIKEGRVIPHHPSEVFSNKYGDCKDKAFLLITMLKEAGIDAYPVLARTSNTGEVIDNFISRQQFNHAVAAVPARYFSDMEGLEQILVRGEKDYTVEDDCVLLDATSMAIPFGQIPWYLEDTKALLVRDEVSRLISIPHSSPNSNSTHRECEAEILDDGSVLCSVKCTRSGQAASSIRSLLQSMTKMQQEEWFQYNLSGRCPGAVLKAHSISHLCELDQPLILNYEFTVPQYVQRIDTLFVFSPGILRNPMYDQLTREKREHSIFFDFPGILIEVIKVKIPAGFRINTLPEEVSESSGFADYSFSCFSDGERVILNRQIAIKRARIGLQEYEEAKAFFSSVVTSQRRHVTLTREGS
ncbi:MAG: DUF3857 domain-containing protein [candidate division Zixibacteria bacterium]|nr:DUF3857 domain-containing protein [candidate division Zixibacteria bacterium]